MTDSDLKAGSRLVVLVLATSFLTPTLAQITPQEKPATQEDEVVRIDTKLVQVDAVVRDSKGRQVSGLSSEDFEILQDGKPQGIATFSYIPTVPEANNRTASMPDTKNAPAPPPANLTREQVRRTIVLVVDDLGISFANMAAVRAALNSFVDQKMQPTDIAVIVTTSGAGDAPQLTTDKRLLRSTVSHVQWLGLRNRVGVQPFQTEDDSVHLTTGGFDSSLIASLSSLEYIVSSLRDLPGRKTVLLFSEDFPIIECKFGGAGHGVEPEMQERMNKLLQASNQASVVINAIDVRGLPTVNPVAADKNPKADDFTQTRPQAELNMIPKPFDSTDWINSSINRKMDAICSTQQSMQYLADRTGGLAIVNTNDLNTGVGRILDDLSGYYLIGYRPPPDTFKKKDGRAVYHRITVRVRRPGLTVRSRDGFLGDMEKSRNIASRPMEQQLVEAINSPFAHGGVRLRLTGLFGSGRSGPYIRILMHIDPRDLTFLDKGDGWHEAAIDVLASSYGQEGGVTDHISRTDKVRARGTTFARLMRNGLDYDLLIGVKKAGALQVRTAVRDSATGRIGTATQFVEVPDLKKGALAISGIALSGPSEILDFSSTFSSTLVQPVATLKISRGVADNSEAQPTAAVRRFSAGMLLEYRYYIFNARVGRDGVLPQLSAEVRVFHDGKLVMSKHDAPSEDLPFLFDPKRLSASGELRLQPDLEPGQYILQIVLTNDLTNRRAVTASQSIDFEIVK